MNKQQMIDRAIEDLGGVYPVDIRGLNYLIKSTINNPYWGEGKYQVYQSPDFISPSWEHICTRKEFEDRVEELNNMKEWNGEGLPPVGIICEGVYDGEWVKVKVLEHCENDQRSDVGACRIVDGGVGVLRYVTEFRPIKTNKELTIEKAFEITEKAAASCEFTFLEALYDAGMLVTPKSRG